MNEEEENTSSRAFLVLNSCILENIPTFFFSYNLTVVLRIQRICFHTWWHHSSWLRLIVSFWPVVWTLHSRK